MDKIKYIECTDSELNSMTETKEEMEESVSNSLKSEFIPNDLKEYIKKNFQDNPNPDLKEYIKFILGILNGIYEDFKVLIRIIVLFTSGDSISILMAKKLVRNNFNKGELETYANKIQFGLYCYGDRVKYFNCFINPTIIFIENVFNPALLPHIINSIDKNLLDDMTLEKYNQNKEKMIQFFKKIYHYLYKATGRQSEKDLE